MQFQSKIEFGKKLFLSNFGLLKFPYKVNFVTTFNCNFRCKMCNIWRKNTKNELNLNEIKRIFKNADFFSWIGLTGGEPFLRNDFVSVIRIIKKFSKNLYILNISTNGSNPEVIFKKVEKILKLNIPHTVVTVSMDGNKKLHDSIRGVKGSWENAIKTFKGLKELKNSTLDVYFQYLLSPFNVGRFLETYNSLKDEINDITPNSFHFSLINSSDHYYSNINSIKFPKMYKKMLEEEIEKIIKLRKFSLNPKTILPSLYLKYAKLWVKKGEVPFKCQALKSTCFINPFGDVYVCVNRNEKLGNIREYDYDIKKILKLKTTQNLKKKICECQNCWTPCEAYQSILSSLLNLTH